MGTLREESLLELSLERGVAIAAYQLAALATTATGCVVTALASDACIKGVYAIAPGLARIRDIHAPSIGTFPIALSLFALAIWNGILDLRPLLRLRARSDGHADDAPLVERQRSATIAERLGPSLDQESPLLSLYIHGLWRTLARQLAAAPFDSIVVASFLLAIGPIVGSFAGSSPTSTALVALATLTAFNAYRYNRPWRTLFLKACYRTLSVCAIGLLERTYAPRARRAGFWLHVLGVAASVALGFGALVAMRAVWSPWGTVIWGTWGLCLYAVLRTYSCVVFFDINYESQMAMLVFPVGALIAWALLTVDCLGSSWSPAQCLITVSGAVLFGWSLGGILLQRTVRRELRFLSPPVVVLQAYPKWLSRLRSFRLALPVLRLIERTPAGKTRDAFVLLACLQCELGDYRGVLKTAKGARARNVTGDTIASFEILAKIQLGDLDGASEQLTGLLARDLNNPYFLHDQAYLFWHLGKITPAIHAARLALRYGGRIKQSRQRVAMLRLLAELRCEQVLRTGEATADERDRWLGDARRRVTNAYLIQNTPTPGQRWASARYWPLVYTDGLVDMCSGDLRGAALKFLRCSAHRRDASAILRVGTLSMIGTRSFLRAKYALRYVERATAATNDRLRQQAQFHLERIREAKRSRIMFTQEILRFDIGSPLIPAEAVAATNADVQDADDLRRQIFKVSFVDIVQMSLWNPTPTMIQGIVAVFSRGVQEQPTAPDQP